MSRSTVIPRRLRLVQSLDRSLGAALCATVAPRARTLTESAARGVPVPPEGVERILVIRPGGLGDAVLTWPLINALRAGYPGATLDVLAERRNASAYQIGDGGPQTLCYDRDSIAVWRALRAARYDIAIDTEQYHHLSVLVANALRPRWLCGFDTLARGRFQTHAVPYDEDEYEAQSFLRLAESLVGRPVDFEPGRAFLAVSGAAQAWADEALAMAPADRLVAVVPVAGGEYRLWHTDRYADVTRWLIERDYRVVLLGGADAVAVTQEISGQVRTGRITNLAGRTTLAQTAAILRRSRLSVSADTGVLHLACGVGTPTVSLFGPGRYRQWGPRGERHRIVRLGLPCSPCTRGGFTPPCQIGVACMRDLGSAPVIAAIGELLTATEPAT